MKTLLLLAAAKLAKPSVDPTTLDVQTYIVAAVCALGFLLLAILVANMIKFEPGANPKDPKKRRAWFWILGVLGTILAFVLLFFVLKPVGLEAIDWTKCTPKEKTDYINGLAHYNKIAGIATGACFVLYILLGLILSKMFKTKKIGNWF